MKEATEEGWGPKFNAEMDAETWCELEAEAEAEQAAAAAEIEAAGQYEAYAAEMSALAAEDTAR